MALQSNTTIFISGTEVSAFKSIQLHQSIDSHHRLELVCRMDVLENLTQALGESSKNYLGETITIQTSALGALSGYETLEFKGIVSQITTIKGHEASSGDEVVITALSPTFIADDGPHYASYNDLSLSEILDRTFSDYDRSKLEVQIQPNNTATLHYSVQNGESAYNYASRLAAQYGEWFYYNGSKLIFGAPETEELTLTYGFDLKEYNLNLTPQSHNYKFYANDYLLNDVHEKDAKDISSGASGYSGFVSSKSDSIFTKETKVWHNLYNDPQAKQRLDSSIELQKKAIQIQQVKLNGISDNPGVKLGNIVNVEGANYRVISITHSNSENGDYENRFEAVTAEFDAYPNTNINAFPKSGTQTATVLENADPEGLGRIRVQMPWQKTTGEMTPWIRIVTPHAGGDKGFHFIPETGEEVLIGFEGNNAEHPYMLGSLYNGNERPNSWKTSQNDIKAIKTRSGHTIELNDTSNGESITIIDKKGNHLIIDTAGESISINALKDINISAGENINISAGKNISINAGENIDESAGQNISIIANKDMLLNASGNMTEMAENRKDLIDGDFSRQSTTSDEYANEMTLFSAEDNLTMQSSKSININSAEKSKLF
ncbi:type VI secretion system Vgr family protein [Olleya sp. ITB9]|uniref:type VI secretion system Vgr family protein n=1 Tax=Olleya sp. ITB9 TaxID=1715648 RepID=UPI0006D14A94|nr:phage baseplate assembly protein V [Olleya sp. ITB9]